MFFYVFFTVYIFSHLYVLHGIIHGFGIKSAVVKIALTVFVVSAALWSVYAHTLARGARNESALLADLIQIAYVWLGVLSIFVFLFFLRDLVFIFARNGVFMRYSTLAVCVLTMVCSAYCVWNVRRGPVLKSVSIKAPNLPTDKFTVVELADMHIDSCTRQEEIDKIVEISNGLDPDMIVLVGDIIEKKIQGDETYGLEKLKAVHGIFAVSGNHEYYAGISNFYSLCENIGAVMLDNSSALVADSVYVAGVSDASALKRFSYGSADPEESLKNVDFKKPVIFLSHQPKLFDEVSEYPVTLQLSGHMHAGQIPPFDLIEKIFFKYFYGLYEKNGSYLYVTSGTRWWGPPMRLFSRSEIVKITLYR